MSENNNQKFLQFAKKILKKIQPRFSFHYVAYTTLFLFVIFSVVSIVTATTPNPGHPWSELGDGVFVFTNSQTVTPYTYTFPAANSTVLTTNAAVTVAQGGTNLTSIADKTLLVTTAANTLGTLVIPAGQSIRRNAGDTAFEAYAPAAGMSWPAGGAGIPNYNGSSAWGTSYTTSGSGTVVALNNSPALTTPTVVTSIVGDATFAAFNTVTTNLSLGGAATTLTIGGTPTTAITHNYSTNATATATTKTVNLGTGGAAGSTTNINIGANAGGTTTINSPTLALGTGSLTMTGSLGATGARLTKGWFTDLQTTNAPIIDSLTASRVVVSGASKELTSATTTTTQVNYLSSATGTTGTTSSNIVFSTTPTFTTNITTPLVLGGSTTTSPLTFQTTSGVGTTGADMHFLVGNAGGTEAMTILNNGNVGINTTAPNDFLTIKTTSAVESATLGSELITGSGWTSTGWTGSYPSFTHTTGNTTPLTWAYTPTTFTNYQISFTVTGRTAGGFTISLDGQTARSIANTYSASDTVSFRTYGSTTANLLFTPTSTFDGTISGISIKVVSPITNSAFSTYDSTSSKDFEFRPTTLANLNLFMGIQSGKFNVTGNDNLGFGSYSLANNVSGQFNVAVGANSLQQNSSGEYNTAVGGSALFKNTTGVFNTAFGASALNANTEGGYNVGLGSRSLSVNTTGNNNVGIGGYGTLIANTTGSSNIAVGGYALTGNITGSNNVSIGLNSLYASTLNNNTALGYQAGRFITGGSTANTAPSNSLYLGYNTKANADSLTNEIVIGYNATGNGSNTATIGDSTLLRTYLTGVNLSAGTATAGTAPLKFTSGTVLGTTEAGAIEYDGTHLYFTAANAGTRYQLDQQSGGSMTWPAGGAGIPNYSGSSSWGTSYTTIGSGTVLALATTPTFTTNITTPLVLGGSTTTSPLTFQTTSGVGTTGADMHFKVGNAGGTEAMTILNSGNVGINATGPRTKLDVIGTLSLQNNGLDTATLGSELLTNPSFATDLSSWTNGGNWSYSSGSALHTTGSVATLSQNVSVVSGNTYLVTVTMSSRTAGDLVFQLGSSNYPFSFLDSGNFNTTEYKTFVATTTGSVSVTLTPTTDFDGKVDDVSVKLVTLSSVTSTQNIYNTGGTLSNELRTNATLNDLFLGLNSGSSNISGARNTALGVNSLPSNTTGYQNTGMGFESFYSNTTGFSNTGLGFDALRANISGARNVALGVYSMLANTTGETNTAVGTHSLQNSTTGTGNVAIGMSSMMIGVNTGNYNTAVGAESLYKNTSGQYNVASGWETLYNNTTGGSNTAFGSQALYTNVGNSYSTAIGVSSLSNSTGASNTALGGQSGRSITTGSSNTFIGYSSGFDASQLISAVNSTAIGNGTYTTASNQVVIGNTSITQTLLNGNVGIGVIGPTAVLHLKAGSATANTAPLKFTSGTVLGTTEAGAVEYDGTHLYFTATNGGTRYQLDQQSTGGSMTWPAGGAGIPNYSGSSSWGTSYTTIGSGTVLALATTPTFTTNITTPLVLGGSTTTSPLTFQTTSGVGTTGADMHFLVGNAGGTEAMTILNSGNVGIATLAPTYHLDVKGTAFADGIRSDMGFDIYQVPLPTAPTAAVSTGGSVDTGDHWYGVTYITALGETAITYTSAVVTTTAGNNTVTLTIPTSTDPRVTGRKIYRSKVASVNKYVDYYVGAVANNTATTYVDTVADASIPGTVAGAGFYRMNTTSNNISINGTRSLTIDPNGTFLGVDAGKNVTSGGLNVGIGHQAGYNMTTGNYSVLIGENAGLMQTTARGTIAIGESAMPKNQTGAENTAVGWRAGAYGSSLNNPNYNTFIGSNVSYNSTSSNNTVVGAYAGYGITTGGNNTILGYYAGRYLADGATSYVGTGAGNVFLGYDSRANANADANEIVLGYQAIGNGSNTATIGNSSLLRTYLTGVNLKAGSATAGTAPLKFTSGTVLGTTEAGAIEYDGTHLYFTATNAGSRYQLDQQAGGVSMGGAISGGTSGSILFVNSSNQFAQNNANFFWDDTNTQLKIGGGANFSFTTATAVPLNIAGNINTFLQAHLQNKNAGTSASTDFVATSDNGTESTNYIDMGINSSGYTDGVFGVANDAYLYNMGQNLYIGTGTAAKSLSFLTGGTSITTNKRLTIDGSGNITSYLGAGIQQQVTATAAPTSDMFTITNTGFANTTAGVSALQVTYVGGATAGESSAARIDTTPGATSGGQWNGLRIVPSSAAASGVVSVGLKLENNGTSVLNGVDRALEISGSGWDSGLSVFEAPVAVNSPFGGIGRYQNFLVQSENFATTWTTSNATATANQTGPNSIANSAYSIATSLAGGYVQQSASVGASALTGRTFNFSVWLKAASNITSQLSLTSATPTTPITQNISVGTSWRRYSVSATFATDAATAVVVRILPTSSGTGTVYAWGAQLEEASSAGVYAATGAALLANTNNTSKNNGIVANNSLKINATSIPTLDMVAIGNQGYGVTAAGVSALQIDFAGGVNAIEASAQRIDLTGGTTAGSTWNGLRIVQGVITAGTSAQDFKMETAALTQTTAVTTNLRGLNLAVAGTLSTTTTGASNIINWTGINMVTPTLSAGIASSAINADNLKITTSASVTATGTVINNGINIAAAGSAGTLNGLLISGITPSTGTETGLNIGSGWDTAISVVDSQAVANTLVNFTTSNTGQTGSSLLVQTGSTAAPTNGLVYFNFNGARTGAGNGFQVNDASTTAATAMKINLSSTTSTTNLGLTIASSSTALTTAGANIGSLLNIQETGAMTALGATGSLVSINASGANAVGAVGSALNINIAGSAQLMQGIKFTDASTGNLGTTAATSGAVLFSLTGAHTGYGFQVSDVATAGTTMAIINNAAVTTGILQTISSSSTALTTAGTNTGSLFNVISTGATTAESGNLAEIAATTGARTTFTGNLLEVAMTGASAASNTGSLINITDTGAANLTKLLNLSASTTAATTQMMKMTYAGLATVATTNTYIQFLNSAAAQQGAITGTGTPGNVLYTTTSDARMKHDISDTHFGITDLMNINVHDFVFNADPNNNIQTGFVAQELYKIYPQAVATNGDDGLIHLDPSSIPWSIDYGKITPLLVKSIQDQQSLLGDFNNGNILELSVSIEEIQGEISRDPVAIISSKITENKKFLTDFVSARVTAIRGYFDEVFANKTHQKMLCVGDQNEGGETCITKLQLDQLLNNQTANVSYTAPSITPAPDPIPTSTPDPISTTLPTDSSISTIGTSSNSQTTIDSTPIPPVDNSVIVP